MSASVVLVQTDIVDSTQLAERLGDVAMAAVWAEHDRAARHLLREWRGREIDRSDGFLLRFDSVDEAVGFAMACHDHLAGLEEPLQMRVGVHAGPLLTRENSPDDIEHGARPLEVGGLTIPITSRVMSLAVGRQTLMTAAARALLRGTAHRVHSHGHWRLKGVEEPFELFEIGGIGAPFAPPADAAKAYCVVRRNDLWVPRRTISHSLPAERNAFIGRTGPLDRLSQRLREGTRLISVVGPGGIGKTRLVQRFGWKWLGDFEGGVWFCDLSQATTLDGVVSAVAQGLGVPLGQAPPIEQLGAAIAGRGACIVVLDNLEQVAGFADETVGRWLEHAPEARFVVTTRTVLNIDGEEVLSLVQMPRAEGSALFVQRAQAARHDFVLGDSDRPQLESLIALLDGLPLAIELAAARVRIMGIGTLVERMKERFRLLASQGGHVGRHATLRAALDWSWDLLTRCERAALAQASVFEGGFGLAGFEAVVDVASFPDAPSAMDLLQSLVDKSWVQQTGELRFGLLTSVQVYASDRLGEPASIGGGGEEGRLAAQRRHWRLYAKPDAAAIVAEGWTDLDNYVQACLRATTGGDAHSAAGALENAWQALKLCGPFKAILALAHDVDALSGLTSGERAQLEYVTGSALLLAGSAVDAEKHFDAGLRAAIAATDGSREAMIRCQLGELYLASGRTTEAAMHLEAAQQAAARLGDTALHCIVFNALGNLQHATGRLEEARSSYLAALEIARTRRDLRWEGGVLGNLGAVNHVLGRHAEARRHYLQALTLVQRTGDRRWEGNTRCNLGLVCSELDEVDEARKYLDLALISARELGHRKLEFTVLCNLGILAEGMTQLREARQFYESAMVIARVIDDVRCQGQCHGYLGLLHGRMGEPARAAVMLHTAHDLLAAADDHWNLILVLCGLVELAIADGDVAGARDTLDRADALDRLISSAQSESHRTALERARSLVSSNGRPEFKSQDVAGKVKAS